jgi:phosphoglycolate phosphatase-like HAD superfamily hydrolase
MGLTAIIDIDGTLVDTNYQHAIAWYRAFRQHGLVLPVWRIHRHIGMGGDHMVAALATAQVDEDRGDAIRASEKDFYRELIAEVEPMEGARALVVELGELGHTVVLASSAKAEEVDHYLDLVDVRNLVQGWTTSADVDATKPEPDLIRAAMAKSHDDKGVVVGDSTFDCEAAARAGLDTIAVLTGGFSDQELRDAGAALVFESIEELRRGLGRTPFTS